MKEFIEHEKLEMLVLDGMRRIKILDQLTFGGGTMLRLCHDLPRFSTDFDFYMKETRTLFLPWAKKLTAMYEQIGAQITDEEEKKNSFLWEIRLAPYPKRLKTEIRKEPKESRQTELNIAHSPYSTVQVRLRALTLAQMWSNKVEAMLDRNEIRDAYDLEFLTRRGQHRFKSLPKEKLRKLLEKLEGYSPLDYKVKLGSVLLPDDRKVVLSNRFSYLKGKINETLQGIGH